MPTRRYILAGAAGAIFAPALARGHGVDHAQPLSRAVGVYRMPPATLLDHHGAHFGPAPALAREGPVLLNFIFTTCPGICPMLSALFAETIDALGPEAAALRLWSVSIDPDYDTPARLAAYADLFAAPPQWRFLTGTPAEVARIRDAFDMLDDSKMSHRSVVFLRLRGMDWARFEGTLTGRALADEVRQVLAGTG